jgi:enolase
MDIVAAEFYKNKYNLDFKNPETKEADWINSDQLGEMYKGFIKDYPFVSIEAPF